MTNPFRLLVALLLVSFVSASIVPKKAVLSSRINKRQLSIRGGAGPLDPELVTKVGTGAFLVQGVSAALAPEPCLEAYGGVPTPASVLCMRRIGVSLLDLAVMANGMIFKDWNVNTAAGMSAVIWALDIAGSTLNDEASTVGFSNTNMIVWLAIHLATAYLYFTNADCANTVMKAFSIFTIATCSPIMFFPSAGFQSYGFDLARIVDSDLATFKVLGACITAVGVFIGFVACGVDPTKALGYSLIPVIINSIIMLFITKESDNLGTPKGPAYFWFLFDIIVAATLGIGSPAPSID